jgi:hypothetical protein
MQANLDYIPHEADAVANYIVSQLVQYRNPSAWELVEEVEKLHGWRARWGIEPSLTQLAASDKVTRADRDYLVSLLKSQDLGKALRNDGERPGRAVRTGIDELLRTSKAYRNSEEFQQMVSFMGRFRDYAPYNNMLVRLQNPSCSFFATKWDWERRFKRTIKEDAHPMLILAPMHPVMLVYELDQTEGEPVPKELLEFAQFEGNWDPKYLDRLQESAAKRDHIRIEYNKLSSSNGGFATTGMARQDCKVRIVIHDGLDGASRFGVLCHELAHIYLGHLGGNRDGWWPGRCGLTHKTVEIEAETVAYLVTARLGLSGSSAAYVCRHLGNGPVPKSVSLDLIAKAAARIEDMARHSLPARPPKKGEK